VRVVKKVVDACSALAASRPLTAENVTGLEAHEAYVTVACEVSGQDRSGFLKDWLYGTKTPRMPGHPDWTVTP